jgi:uncharacterized phiE125 gp8 family phage protein
MSTRRIKQSRVTIGPTVEPITLAQARVQCKLEADYTDEDEALTVYIQAARELVEEITGRSLITQTRVMRLDYFPSCYEIHLDHGRLLTVTSVEYYADSTDVLTTLSSSDYWVDTHSEIPRITVKTSWPSTYDRPNAVVITYTAGYGATASTVPGALVQAVKELVAHMYEHRGDEKGFDVPDFVMNKIQPYIIYGNAWY